MSRRVLIAGALVLAVGGCGGGGDKGPTHAQFVARADRICREAAVQARPSLLQLSTGLTSISPASVRRLAPAGERLHAVSRAYLARLGALERPSADNARIERFLALSRQVSDAIGRAATAAGAGRTVEALATLQGVQQTARDANAAAADYGLRACARLLPAG